MAFLALFTRFFDRSMRSDTAVTGTLSLSGHVAGVGSINSKIRGAKKAGYKRVVIPKRAYHDVDEALRNDNELELLQSLDVFDLLNFCLIDAHRKWL